MTFDGRLLSGISVLASVVQHKSFAKASGALGLTASGVSRSISRLEDRVGIRLFDRTTRSLSLTDEGRRFYEQVAPLLAGIEEASTTASGSAGIARGRLRVDIDPFFSRLVLSGRINQFLSQHPELSLELITREHVGDLVADSIDVAVRFGEPGATTLIARKLLETRVLTVAAPSYLDRRGRPNHPSELAHHECILFMDPLTGTAYDWEFRSGRNILPVKTSGRLLVSDVGTMIGECRAGGGVAQLLALGVQKLIDAGELVELFPDWQGERFPLFALHPSRHHPPAKVRAFIDFALAAVHGSAASST